MILEAHSSIVIQPVNNGWIVLLPMQIRWESVPIVDEADLKYSAKILREGVGKDTVLPKGGVEEPQELNIEAIKDKSVHIFTSFKDVIAFLSYKIVENDKK